MKTLMFRPISSVWQTQKVISNIGSDACHLPIVRSWENPSVPLVPMYPTFPYPWSLICINAYSVNVHGLLFRGGQGDMSPSLCQELGTSLFCKKRKSSICPGKKCKGFESHEKNVDSMARFGTMTVDLCHPFWNKKQGPCKYAWILHSIGDFIYRLSNYHSWTPQNPTNHHSTENIPCYKQYLM